MRLLLFIAALATGLIAGEPCKPQMPCYASGGVVNGATFKRELAPGTIFSIFGTNLAWDAQSRTRNHSALGLGGVTVSVNGHAAYVFYVSPGQVNALVPPFIIPGPAEIRVMRDGAGGPPALVQLDEYAPGLFQYDQETAIALRYPDWRPATAEYPALPGEIVSLFATGLGPLDSSIGPYDIPDVAAPITGRKDLRILLNGVAVDDRRIEYAGCAPGYAGLYQINIRLPEVLDHDPEIMLVLGTAKSRAGVRLRTAQ